MSSAPDAAFQDPKWVREIERFLVVKSQFILWGNIHDIYPYQLDGKTTSDNLGAYLQSILSRNGYSLIFEYEPFRLSLAAGDAAKAGALLGSDFSKPLETHLTPLSEMAEKIVQNRAEQSALIIHYGSRVPALCPQQIEEFHYKLFRLSIKSQPIKNNVIGGHAFNLVIWVMDKENDLPAWYSLDNSRVRILPIPKPDHEIRRQLVRTQSRYLGAGDDFSPERREKFENIYVDQTGGLFAREVVAIRQLAERGGLNFAQIPEAIRQYKLGVPDNPWDKLNRKQIEEDAAGILSSRVIGQGEAVNHSLDIIKRSIFGLSGSQFSQTAQRPKGVLFFAGPTGVGKTELAKGLTELIFGAAGNYIRFDMSEFNQDHSDQRLLGAPPGYVGYDVGGELTNSIKQNPFSLVLFDEIEKAHPKIMDVFLQILDDGRLTSGRGETVYFSDSLLVFTSNLGIYQTRPDGTREERITPEMPYLEVKQKINEAIEEFFQFRLNRPEILNRLGKNIVVFDFIREVDARAIFDKMLRNVLAKLFDSHAITVTIDDQAREFLAERAASDLKMGGRGIGNALEECFVNPLARALFTQNAARGESYLARLVPVSSAPAEKSLVLVRTV